MSNLAHKIKQKLQEKHLSVHALEKIAGLKPSAVHNILQGKSKNPTANTLQAISQVLDCEIGELIGNTAAIKQKDLVTVWKPELYLDSVKLANELFAKAQLKLTKEKALSYIEEIYNYSIKGKLQHADQRFARWLIEK